MIKENKLSWALIVATYNRHDILMLCVRRALMQTYPPSEIIIVDASTNWRRSRDALIDIAAPFPDTNLIYEPANIASTTTQRNQGIDISHADIAFLIDDDSLMHLDCAEHIMEIYTADTNREVVAIQASSSEDLPSINGEDELNSGLNNIAIKEKRGQHLLKYTFIRFLYHKLFLMNIYEMFIPYYGNFLPFTDSSVPECVKKYDVSPVHLLQGFAMTYRREVIKRVRFDPLLRAYAAAEDLDASYRASYEGALLIAHKAMLKHCRVSGGRVNRVVSVLFLVTNNAIFLRKHSSNLKRDVWKYRIWIIRRYVASFLADGLSRRWSLPSFRGCVYGGITARKVLKMNLSELNEWYPSFQQRILAQFK